ncbi:GNAT family N-acetyltransferase [Undibacterium sp. Ji22W]|uniref:GNAT family N-acetyltransferase n=1 Tax=Undibacterium sp. Ji22W TaxID=3413038 RepID=UPI003BF2143A
MMSLFDIRPMHLNDIESVLRIQAACYSGDIPESANSLRAKLVAAPRSCFVATAEDEVIAYLIAIPWVSTAPPELNAPDCDIPTHADCLYLHDLSVHPNARKSGVGRALIECFFARCAQWQYAQACLVAVQNSAGYWRRFGFQTAPGSTLLAEKLASYAADAEFLIYQMHGSYH